MINQKKLVGEQAASYVENHTVVGLGTGSTAVYMVDALAKRAKEEDLTIECVATSNATFELAKELGLDVKELSEVDEIDLTIDGADEISPNFQGIKGGGGALTREKIVAVRSKKNIWIADDSKVVEQLGAFPLAVEVLPFGHEYLLKTFERNGYQPNLRTTDSDEIYETDSGNYIIDLNLEVIEQPKKLAQELKSMVGVVEHGLFIDIVDKVLIGSDSGEVTVAEP